MTWLGVPILDWVILAALLVLGAEAWITTRPAKPGDAAKGKPPVEAAPSGVETPVRRASTRAPDA
jgi:hypothetical protein